MTFLARSVPVQAETTVCLPILARSLWEVPRQGDAAPFHGFVLMLHVGVVLLVDVDGLEPEQKPFLLSVHVVIEVKKDDVQCHRRGDVYQAFLVDHGLPQGQKHYRGILTQEHLGLAHPFVLISLK